MTYQEIKDKIEKSDKHTDKDGKVHYTINIAPYNEGFLNFVKEKEAFFIDMDWEEVETYYHVFGWGFNNGFELGGHIFNR